MLGYCGINCDECDAYKGTVNSDMALLEKVAGKFWNGKYSAKDWVCLGCLPADQQFIAQYCSNCQIRTCAIERNLSSCAACDDFENCSRLHDFIKGESDELLLKLELLRGRYLERQNSLANQGGG
jgi:hypothetical protein